MANVSDLLKEVKKSAEDIATLKNTIGEMAKAKTDATSVLKTLLANPNAQGAVNWNGSDQLGLISIHNPRQKALGWGSYLQAVSVASGGKPQGEFGNPEHAYKFIEKSGGKPIQKTALAEGSGATGGYTVPPQFYADLMRLVAEDAFVKSLCTTIPMQSRSILIPALDHSATPAAGTSAFFGGLAASWQPEAATINESEPTFRQVELVARDLVFHTIASNQLLQDNAVALDTLLTSLFKEAISWIIDYFILRGNGAGQPMGVLNAPCAYSLTRSAATTFKLVDAAKMLGRLLQTSWKKAIWIMHPSVLEQCIQMTNGATNAPFLVWANPAPATGGGPAAVSLPTTFFGLPVYWSEKLPALGTKGDVMLVDLSRYLVGDRMALQIETSPHVKFLTNQMVWRIIARWDGQPWLNNVVVMGDGSYQMSPFVVLN